MATNCRRPQTEKEVEQGKEELEMIAPPLKRFCSSVVSGVRKIAVEGNIATGKTTFLRLLEEKSPSYHVVSEPLSKWQSVEDTQVTGSQQCGSNLLDMFYKEPKRWAYTFQAYACLSRLKAQLRPIPTDLLAQPNPVVFFERSVYSDKVAFAENCHERGLLSDVEWSVYEDWHTFLLESLPLTFDAFIYLQTSPKVDVCLERMHKRDRPEEREVTEDYLRSLHEKHEAWLIHKKIKMPTYQTDTPVLVLNCDREFETDQEQADLHLEKVAEFIESLHEKTV